MIAIGAPIRRSLQHSTGQEIRNARKRASPMRWNNVKEQRSVHSVAKQVSLMQQHELRGTSCRCGSIDQASTVPKARIAEADRVKGSKRACILKRLRCHWNESQAAIGVLGARGAPKWKTSLRDSQKHRRSGSEVRQDVLQPSILRLKTFEGFSISRG